MTKKILDSLNVDGTVQATSFTGSGAQLTGISQNATLPGFVAASGGSVTSSDTILTAIEKLEYKVNNVSGGSGSSLPTLVPNTFLFTNGAIDYWRPIYQSDIIPNPSITSFNTSPTIVEVGQSITTPAFTATYSQTPTSASFHDSIYSTPVTLSNVNSFNSFNTYLLNTVGSVTFTLAATFITTITTTTSISWLERLYYGHASSFVSVSALQNSSLVASRIGTHTITASTNEYIYFAIPANLGTPTFYVGGFAGGIDLLTTINVTNAYGNTLSYNIYQSDNVSLGIITVQIQ